jgi:hypothetical protein
MFDIGLALFKKLLFAKGSRFEIGNRSWPSNASYHHRLTARENFNRFVPTRALMTASNSCEEVPLWSPGGELGL